MSSVSVFGLCAAAAVGLGLYGLITNPQSLRKILAFNLLGSGVFLLFRGSSDGGGLRRVLATIRCRRPW
ncbi:multisubunit Na+/H+ antiporter MnhC subunit [Bradyrhizobium sp. LM3.4]